MNERVKSIVVVIDVFSGAPNPYFTIEEEKTVLAVANSLRNAIKIGPATKVGGFDVSSRLGYRGLMVQNEGNKWPDLPLTIYVSNGRFSADFSVQASDHAKKSHSYISYPDEGREIERMLLVYAKERKLVQGDMIGSILKKVE